MNKQYKEGRLASLKELMGGKADEMKDSYSMDDLPELIGEAIPDLPRDRVGRLRLQNLLQKRYGVTWRSYPGLTSLMDDFDKDVEVASLIKANRGDK